MGPISIDGWAVDSNNPAALQQVAVYANNVLKATATASQTLQGLGGIASGHAFSIQKASLGITSNETVSVRFAPANLDL